MRITNGNYNAQMSKPNRGWVCPRCHGPANFKGDYIPCNNPECSGWIDLEDGETVCETCNLCNQTIAEFGVELAKIELRQVRMDGMSYDDGIAD
jgi:hypothetical protein